MSSSNPSSTLPEHMPLTGIESESSNPTFISKTLFQLFSKGSILNETILSTWDNFPLFSLMIHYTIINAVFKDVDCTHITKDSIKIPFIIYWVFLLILTGIMSFFKFFYNAKNKIMKNPFILVLLFCHSILTMTVFISWSIIRSKPFKCFDEGIYISGPIVLWIIQSFVFFYHFLMVWTNRKMNWNEETA